MREVYEDMARHEAEFGITPACAGSMIKKKLIILLRWDHPRVCGKYHVFKHRFKLTAGSPPRVREVSIKSPFFKYTCGITPACAGSIKEIFTLDEAIGDHPRVCGKY